MYINKPALLNVAFLLAGSLIGAMTTIQSKNVVISQLKTENTTMDNQVAELLSERVRIAHAILNPESFHLIEPEVTTMTFSEFDGELVWFTGQSGISYSQLNQEHDQGISVTDGKTISKPSGATAFMLKGKSKDGWKVTYATR